MLQQIEELALMRRVDPKEDCVNKIKLIYSNTSLGEYISNPWSNIQMIDS